MLDPSEVHVFFARPEDLDDSGRRDAALALLTADERERIARFHFERDRRLHLCARALLRTALSRCAAGVAPETWRFAVRPGGRPELAESTAPLRFSVSHTGGLAMVAVAVDRDVGADAERIPPIVPPGVVERTFTAAERAALDAAPEAERPARFAAHWTLKEAYAKARGLGLSLAFEAIGFELAPPRLVEGDDDPASWQLECISPTAEHRAAVCVRRSRDGSLGVRVRACATACVP